MTFLELVREVWREVGGAGDGPSSLDSVTGQHLRLKTWVNRANIEIENKWTNWSFLWADGLTNLAANEADQSLASDLGLLLRETLRIGSRELQFVPWTHYRADRLSYDEMAGDGPEFFTVQPNGQLRFFPAPTAMTPLRYEYHRSSKSLAANTDKPRIPPAYQDAIIWRAKMFWCEFEDDQSGYQSANANFAQAMLRLEASQLPSNNGEHGRSSGGFFQVRAE